MACCLEGSCSIQLSYRVEKSEISGKAVPPEMAAKVKKNCQGAKLR
jgi:hypothetical protein